MIGLGSNRLSVCRRGGMRVTQAGRGGMEWLAGGRGASWASPYSAQATAALLAQFPTQWPTIRDYGFAHPEIVGYMNAYAPEDAKIAYSLVPTLGVRLLVGDGLAYIDTGKLIDGSKKNELEIQFIGTSTSRNFICGAQSTGGSMHTFVIIVSTAAKFEWYQANTGNSNISSYVRGTLVTLKALDNAGALTMYKDGVSVYTNTRSGTVSNHPMFLFCDNAVGNPTGRYANTDISKARLKTDDQDAFWFVPFKLGVARSADQVYPSSKGAQTAGTCGMIDLLTGIFYPNANSSGSFTISETPSS